jgi:phosphate transport system protein
MLDQEIAQLKRRLIEYAGLVETMISKSIEGLVSRDRGALDDVIQSDEPRANDFEIELDEQCTVLIAKFQPAAKDLRTIMMISQMNNDLERMADLAVNIVESALFLIERPQVKPLIDIPNMGEVVKIMVKDAIDAFIREDALQARSVCERDQLVDDYNDQITRELITYIAANPSTIERSFQLIRIANSLERIADLSTNLCEDAIFVIDGRVIKHGKDERDNPS